MGTIGVSRQFGFAIVSLVFAARTRRDDMESLFLVLLYLLRGDLPWGNAR